MNWFDWLMFGIAILALSIGFDSVRRLNRATRHINALTTIVRTLNANRTNQTLRPNHIRESFRAIPSGTDTDNG